MLLPDCTIKTFLSLIEVSAPGQLVASGRNAKRLLTDLDARLSILELAQSDLAGRVSKPVADFLNESRVRGPGEDASLTHLG